MDIESLFNLENGEYIFRIADAVLFLISLFLYYIYLSLPQNLWVNQKISIPLLLRSINLLFCSLHIWRIKS